jgi:bifunctional non-homologous end joining protein LigD
MTTNLLIPDRSTPWRKSQAKPRRIPAPHSIAPMLASASGACPVSGKDFGFEYKWDGIRAIAYCDGRRVTLSSRNQLDFTLQYPELQPLARAMGRSTVLDGEIVALDDLDRPSFPRLQKRLKVTDPAVARRLTREIPVYYFIFDVLYVDGKPVMDRPLTERRAILEGLTLQGPNWQVSPMHINRGAEMLEAARQNMLEGIVAKRLDSIYLPGVRSRDWLKIKLVLRQEFVVGGWTNEKNTEGGLGALQVGYYDAQEQLRYAGGVGSGFTNATAHSLLTKLTSLESNRSPFADKLPRRGVRWCQPELVVEVEFRRWPEGGMLQQAAFKGVRMDKDAKGVVKEVFGCMANSSA